MQAGEPLFDAIAVVFNMDFVAGAQGLRRVDAGLVALAHLPGGEIGMSAGAVPVAAGGLGVESGVDAKVLRNPVEEPTGEPELVGDLYGGQGANLKLPLARHNLGVDALNLQPGLQTSFQVSLHYLPAVDLVVAHAAVVTTLGRGIAGLREAQRSNALEESILLLDAEDHFVLF